MVASKNSALATRRITPFTAGSNFTTYDTSIFYCPKTKQVLFCIRGAFINGAQALGTIAEEYRPSFDVMLQSSLNQYGAHVTPEGLVQLYENNGTTGTVIVSGAWALDAS